MHNSLIQDPNSQLLIYYLCFIIAYSQYTNNIDCIVLSLMMTVTTSAQRLNSIVNQQDSKWSLYWQNLKQSISGTEEQKQAILRRRVLKFFKDFKLAQNTTYNQRRDLNAKGNIPFNFCPNILVLYGIDYLSNQRISAYFTPFKCKIQNIDYSHSLIIFTGGAEYLFQALFNNLIQKPDSLQQLYNYFVQNKNQLATWREVRGYQQFCFQRKLWVRFAIAEQLNYASENDQRRNISVYEAAKSDFFKKIESSLLKKNMNKTFQKKKTQKQPICCCEKNLDKLIGMIKCCNHNNKRNFDEKSREMSRQRSRSGFRQISRDHHNRNRKGGKMRGVQGIEPTKLIKEITEIGKYKQQKEKTIVKYNKYQPQIPENQTQSASFLSNINKQAHQSDDELYYEMLASMQRYRPFNEKEQENPGNLSMISKKSNSRYSVYEYESGEDDE